MNYLNSIIYINCNNYWLVIDEVQGKLNILDEEVLIWECIWRGNI